MSSSFNSFKFGRKYELGWIMVNMDFASLYPSGEFGLTISPPQQNRFRQEYQVEPRVESNVITLTSRDLSRASRDLPTEFINLEDFSQMSISRQQFLKATVVIFIDDVGRIKTLKNRYQ